jgi:hypothetical protein
VARTAASSYREENQLRGSPFGDRALGGDSKRQFESVLMDVVQPPNPNPDVGHGTLTGASLYGVDDRTAQP